MRGFWAMIGTIGFVCARAATAHEVAPMPIEAGEWYLTANASMERISAPRFEALELYKDDSAFTMSGDITIEDDEGYLLTRRVKEIEFIPSVSLGFGLEGPGESVIRFEFGLEAFNREESYFRDRKSTPDDGFTVEGTDVRAGVNLTGFDGQLGNNDLGILYFGNLEDEDFDIEERLRGGHLSLYFDGKTGNLVYSRGVSVVYLYVDQQIDHEYFTPDIVGLPGLPTRASTRHEFRYNTKSHSFGSRFHYSVGYEVLDSIAVFTMGRFGMFAKYSELKARMTAPCVGACDLTAPTLDFTPGSDRKKIDDWKFAYEARLGIGATVRLGPIRVTAHGGGTRVGGWTTPRVDDEGLDLAKSGGWGYFATGSAGIAF